MAHQRQRLHWSLGLHILLPEHFPTLCNVNFPFHFALFLGQEFSIWNQCLGWMPSFVLLSCLSFPLQWASLPSSSYWLLCISHSKNTFESRDCSHSVSPAWSLEHTDRWIKSPIIHMNSTAYMQAITAPVTMTAVFLLHAMDPQNFGVLKKTRHSPYRVVLQSGRSPSKVRYGSQYGVGNPTQRCPKCREKTLGWHCEPQGSFWDLKVNWGDPWWRAFGTASLWGVNKQVW